MVDAGYLHSTYAQSFAEFGTPYELSSCKGWILIRSIPNWGLADAIGCYPLFTCQNWNHLHHDLEHLKDKIVSLSLVTDPFGNYDVTYLNHCFPDVVIAFKDHCIVDLNRPIESFVSKHHQRYAKQALQKVSVRRIQEPLYGLNAWKDLYAHLIQRHEIRGIAKFSKKSFLLQFEVPGLMLFQATYNGMPVSMLMWYIQEDVGYYHLGASSPFGYELKASFALFWYAIEYFKRYGLKWLDLGTGAGIEMESNDGLSRFKRGWATGTRKVYFCGKIFDYLKYQEIIEAKGIGTTNYFPAYRVGEFS